MIQIELKPGIQVKDTGGAFYKILGIDKPVATYKVSAMSLLDGSIRFYSLTGTPEVGGQDALVLEVANIPTNSLEVEVGTHYLTRDDRRVRVDKQVSQYRYQVVEVNSNEFSEGYQTWKTGIADLYGTESDDDIVALWDQPGQVFFYVLVDSQDPTNKSLWGDLLSQRPSSVPAGKSLYALHMREPLTSSQTFRLIQDTP